MITQQERFAVWFFIQFGFQPKFSDSFAVSEWEKWKADDENETPMCNHALGTAVFGGQRASVLLSDFSDEGGIWVFVRLPKVSEPPEGGTFYPYCYCPECGQNIEGYSDQARKAL